MSTTVTLKALLVSLDMVQSGNGPWLRLEPNLTTPHFVSTSAAFRDQHPSIMRILRGAIRGRWKLVDDAEFEMRAGSKSGKRFPKYCIKLVTEKEKKGLKQNNYLTTRGFVEWRWQPSIRQSWCALSG